MEGRGKNIDLDLLVYRYATHQADDSETQQLDAIFNEDSDAAYKARRMLRLIELTAEPPKTKFDPDQAFSVFSQAITPTDTDLESLFQDSKPTMLFDADVAFAKFQSDIRSADNTIAETSTANLEINNNTDVGSKGVVKRLWIRRVASIAAIFVAIFSAVVLLRGDSYASDEGFMVASLADGSTVQLAPESRLEVIDDRSVRFSGNGFFDIETNPDAPFSVITDAGTVTVLGTEFTVEGKGQSMSVSLREGSVEVTRSGKQVRIEPGQRVDVIGGQLITSGVTGVNAYSLSDGFLQFENTPITVVVSDLERHFNTKITTNLEGCSLTAERFDADDVEQALQQIGKILNAKVVVKGGVFVLEGQPCK